MSLVQQFSSWPKARRTANGYDVCCPAHEDGEPSLSISENEHKLLWHCKAGCDQEAVRSALEARGIQTTPNRTTDSGGGPVQKILAATRPAAGTEAERYLNSRGIASPDVSQARFHRNLLWKDGTETRHFAALVLPVRRTPEGEVVGIQRIFLQDGAKAPVKPAKKSLGTIAGGAFWCGSNWSTIAVTEGAETGFAVAEATGLPFAATLGAKSLEAFTPPKGCDRVYIFGDYDPTGVGKNAAKVLADRLLQKGIFVRVLIPTPIDATKSRDWLDVLAQEGPEAIKTCLEAPAMIPPETSPSVDFKDAWPDPIPLVTPKIDLPEFNLDVLPRFFRMPVELRAKHGGFIPGLPLAFVFLAAAAAAGRSFVVRPTPESDWKTCLNLFGIVIARASSRKTAAYRPFVGMLDEVEKIFLSRAKETRAANYAETKKLQVRFSQLEKLLKKESLDSETSEAYVEEQITIEKRLSELLVCDTRLSTSDATVE